MTWPSAPLPLPVAATCPCPCHRTPGVAHVAPCCYPDATSTSRPMSERAGLIEGLRDEQAARCAYGTRDGDGRTCDCKYASPLRPWASEATGCPELRAAIAVLLGQIVDLPKGEGRG